MDSFGAFSKSADSPSCLNSLPVWYSVKRVSSFSPNSCFALTVQKKLFPIGSKRNTRILECLFQIRDDIVYIFNTDGKTDQIGRYAGLF